MSSPPPPSAPGIVILGAPRSGTTLLRRLLDAHPQIACPPETYLLSAAARFLHEESFASGLTIGVVSGLAFAGFDEAEVLGRLRAMTLGFLEEHARAQGKPRWAQKTAFDAFHVPKIRRLLDGHVRYVCVHRHGLDVAASISDLVDRTGGYVDDLHDYLLRYPQPLEAFARAWVDISAQLEELGERDDAISIRYEDLVEDPEATLGQLFDFVEARLDPAQEVGSIDALIQKALGDPGRVGFGDWKTYGRAEIDASSVGRWRDLPRTTIGELGTICDPTLERLGYAPVGGRPRPSAEVARRRYEMGLLVNRMKSGAKDEGGSEGS